ncbi:matrixin family metalloprotease, partial [uncultured Prochlorococcus sp.]|uniref:matrixin family metalloprotease n=1 Tax=uncultured Prochlorococcus sp. TaxID=159733 RepID=UPI002589CBD5
MCILCNYAGNNIHNSQGLNYIGTNSLASIVSESSDAAPNTSTSYSISVTDTFSGTLSYAGDRDWVAITLTAGNNYTFDLTGSASGDGTLVDPYFRLYSSNGTQLTYNDDYGGTYESRITYEATTTGTYYLSAGSYGDYYTGTYQISSSLSPSEYREFGDFDPTINLSSSNVWSGIDRTNAFMDGLQWDNGVRWGSADPETTTTALNFFIYDNELTIGSLSAGSLLSEERAAYIAAMNAYSSVANITFTESDTATDSHILWASLGNNESFGALGWAVPPDVEGSYVNSGGNALGLTTQNYTLYSTDGQVDDPSILLPGSYYFLTTIHELGHSLGLSHPHDNSATFPGVSSSSDTGDNGLNATPYTVMTYNDVGANDYAPSSEVYSGYLETLGAFDIAATQSLYGANTSQNTGDDTYYLNSNQLNGFYCIWDNGGTDTISAESASDSVSINLNNATLQNAEGGGGYISQIGSQYLGYTIAYNSTGDCIIENAIGSS